MPHPYATDSNERRNITVFLVLLSTAIAVVISRILEAGSIVLPTWVDGLSILSIFGLTYWLFKKYVWKSEWLHKLGVVRTPVLAGTWTGFVVSSHDEHTENRDVAAKINQDW